MVEEADKSNVGRQYGSDIGEIMADLEDSVGDTSGVGADKQNR